MPGMAKRVTDRQFAFGALVVAILVMLAMIFAMSTKGVWYDEVWAKWMARTDLDLASTLVLRWSQDLHMPLFYLLNWLSAPIVGHGVIAHRFLSLLPLVGVVAAGACVAQLRPQMRHAMIVAGILFLTSHDAEYFAEYRPYALIMCSTAILLLLLSELLRRQSDLDWAKDRALAVMLCIAIAVSFNLHYVTSLVSGVLLGMFILDRMRLKHWRWTMLLIVVGLVSTLPVLGTLWLQRGFFAAAVPDFWVDTDNLAAVRSI